LFLGIKISYIIERPSIYVGMLFIVNRSSYEGGFNIGIVLYVYIQSKHRRLYSTHCS